MDNKVLVTVLVPYLEKKYDMFVPVNMQVCSVIEMIKTVISKTSVGALANNKEYALYREEDGQLYDGNALVRDTDIRNDSKIILL